MSNLEEASFAKLEVVLRKAYLDVIKGTYPNAIDGLTPLYRQILYFLNSVDSAPYSELLRFLLKSHRAASVKYLAREIRWNMYRNGTRYGLIEFFAKDGIAHVRINPIVQRTIHAFNPEDPVEHPVIARVPLILMLGWRNFDVFIPPHCASDLTERVAKPKYRLLPDTPIGKKLSLRWSGDRCYLVCKGSVDKRFDWYCVCPPYGKSFQRIKAELDNWQPGCTEYYRENNPLVKTNLSETEFVEQFLTETILIQYRVYDPGSESIQATTMDQIFKAWMTYNRTMLNVLLKNSALENMNIETYIQEDLQRYKNDLHRIYKDRRLTSFQ